MSKSKPFTTSCVRIRDVVLSFRANQSLLLTVVLLSSETSESLELIINQRQYLRSMDYYLLVDNSFPSVTASVTFIHRS